jgi:UDP-N-acetylmuramoylalanine--D-glutamate ligase
VSERAALERESFAGRRVLVLGLGRFDGGLETVRFLRAEGAQVLVSDAAPRESLAEPAARAEALGATLRFGPQAPSLLEGREAVLVNPAVPFDHPVLEAARARGVPVTTEINVVLARSRAPVLAVTGTKGKSTTATLLASMLAAAGHRVHLGGNIGRPLVARLDDVGPADRVVLELSSFQLWWTRALGRSPHVTVVTNLLRDHLDRHGSPGAYAEAKRAALDFQGPEDLAVLPADDPAVRAAGWLEAGRGRRVLYGPGGAFVLEGRRVCRAGAPQAGADLEGLRLLGAHNRRNVLAAAAAVRASGEASWEHVARGAHAVEPLPHRLQPVTEVDGVLYVDDSNGTQPDSTRAALRAVGRPVVLILGGKDKGADPADLLEDVAARARAVVTTGSTGPALAARLSGRLPVREAADVEAAVAAAAALAAPGDAVLLSPAHSSLDQYRSFAERGDRFQAAVRSLLGRRRTPAGGA